MITSLSRFGARNPGLFEDFRREMDHTLSRFFERDVFGAADGTTWFSPLANVAETDSAYEITVDLPGLKPDDFTIELRHGDLWITGARQEEHEETQKSWHRVECRYGQFRRVIPLGQGVDAEKVHAEYKDGVLTITVPKTETAKPRRIAVKG